MCGIEHALTTVTSGITIIFTQSNILGFAGPTVIRMPIEGKVTDSIGSGSSVEPRHYGLRLLVTGNDNASQSQHRWDTKSVGWTGGSGMGALWRMRGT